MASLIKSSNKSIHDALRVLARDIQSEDGAANAAIAEAADRISELGIEVKQLEAEKAELREDKARLENYIAKQMHKLEVENTGQEVKIEQLEAENAALKTALDHQMSYQRELRADKDRLDWLANLDEKERLSFVLGWYRLAPKQVRREIDAAMKEGKE